MPSSIFQFVTRLSARQGPSAGLRFAILILIFSAFALSAPAQDAPTVTITPDSGAVESALFTILIEGLQPDTVYTVEFIFAGAVVYSTEETSDDRGIITFPAGSTEGDLPGIYTVQVSQNGEALASADFELTAKDQAKELPGAVTVTPPTAAIGSLHEIKITGLAAHKRYSVEITAAESQQVAYRRARTSDQAGVIEIEVFAEAGDTLGYQAITIYDADGETVAAGGFTIDAPPEREVAVIVMPSIIAAGSPVEISVSGLAEYAGVSAQVKSDQGGVLIDSVFGRATKDGATKLTFAGPDDMADGPYDIEIFAEGDKVATATLTIGEVAGTELPLDAVVSINPPSGSIGAEHLIEVSGLQPGDDYMLTILDPAGAEEYAAARGSDAAGAFKLRISSTPEDDIGLYTVEIRDQAGDVLLASATFEVAAGADEHGRDALATIEPQSAVIGSSHMITLSNLTPGEQINFDVTFAGAIVYQSSKTADAAGIVRLELVTDAGDVPGDYLITAMRASGNQPTVVLTATIPATIPATTPASTEETPAPAIAASPDIGDLIAGSLAEGVSQIILVGEQDQYLRITVRSDDFAPGAALYDRDDNVIASSSDSRGQTSAVIGPLRMPYSGSYILEIFPSPLLAELAGVDGDFDVSIDPVSVLRIDADVTELPFSLSAANPAAYYELPLKTGDSLSLSVDSDLDSTLQLLSSDGVELAFDDDSGRGLDAEISNLLIAGDDSYLLAVATFDERTAGSGSITLSHRPARTLEDGEVIINLSDKAIRDIISFHATEDEVLTLNLDKLVGDVEDLIVTAQVDGMEVMSYSTMGVPVRLPLSFVMPMSGRVIVSLEKVGVDDGISLAVSLERE